MHDAYEFYGCIDFRTDSYAISVPLLKRRGSNYSYVPRTDNNFIITDFYEMHDVGYHVKALAFVDYKTVFIGNKAPVPIMEDGEVFVVDPDWSAKEIKKQHPKMGNEAFKAFISLRTRMAEKPVQDSHDEIMVRLDDLLSDPVRSKYWISRYSALVRSAFTSGQPSDELEQRLQRARLLWLDKFASKTSLKHVRGMTDVHDFPLSPEARNMVLTNRFERLILKKGIFTPLPELRAYQQLFPKGVVTAFAMDESSGMPAWERVQLVSRFLSDQMFQLTLREVGGGPRNDDPNKWLHDEIARLLEFYTVLAGETFLLDEPCRYLWAVYQRLLNSVKRRTSKRHALINAIEQGILPDEEWHFDWTDLTTASDMKWIFVTRKLIEDYDKLVLISKILRPMSRKKLESEIAFSGVDHALIDALRLAHSHKNLSELRTILL